jgi:8-oxo-dGTP pyrophosphatase MutT (NUDIX family)
MPGVYGYPMANAHRFERATATSTPKDDRARQVAALPWRNRDGLEILLITSRETRRWVIPKGWPIGGLDGRGSAAREAFEEAGIEGRTSPGAIGTFSYDKRRANGSLVATEVSVFALEVIVQHDEWPEQGQRQCQWFSADEAATKVGEPELAKLISAFAAWSAARRKGH